MTDTEMLEYVCNENEKDHAHLVGKASDDRKNAVPATFSVIGGRLEFVGSDAIFHAVEGEVKGVRKK